MLNDDGNDGTMLSPSHRSFTIYPTDMACGLASGSLRHVSKSFTNQRRDFLIAPSISSTIHFGIRFSDDPSGTYCNCFMSSWPPPLSGNP